MWGAGKSRTFFEEIKSRLTAFALGGAIQDSFSHAELVKFLASHGQVYPGIRMQALSIFQLSQDFADDAWKDPELFGFLEKEMDRKHARDIEEMMAMTPEDIRRLLSGVGALLKENAIGKMLWVLLKDGRPEVMDLAEPLLKSVCKITRKENRRDDKRMDFHKRFEEGRLTHEEIKMLRQVLEEEKEKNLKSGKELREKRDRIEALKQERERTKEDLASMRGERDRLKNVLGKTEKEISGQTEVIRGLEEASRGMSRSEKKELEHRVHDLERTGRKQEHEILELRRQALALEGNLKAREELCGRLKDEAGAARNEKKALEKELDRHRKTEEQQVPKQSQTLPPSALPQKGKRLGVFVDAGSLRFAARMIQKKIDFRALLETITRDRRLVKAVLYAVVFPGKDPSRFFSMIEHSGFEVRSRDLARKPGGPEKGFWDMGIAMDAVRLSEKNDLDIVHLVTGDGDFADLVRFLKTRGVQTEISAFPSFAAEELIKCPDRFMELGEEVFRDDVDASVAGSPGEQEQKK
jgi:uncharacterized LabA/DUF88 family protein